MWPPSARGLAQEAQDFGRDALRVFPVREVSELVQRHVARVGAPLEHGVRDRRHRDRIALSPQDQKRRAVGGEAREPAQLVYLALAQIADEPVVDADAVFVGDERPECVHFGIGDRLVKQA